MNYFHSPIINTQKKSGNFLSGIPLIAILLLYAAVKMFYIDTIPRWDGAWYFTRLLESVDNFNFTFKSFLDNFNWYGHPSMGYAFLMSVSQFLDSGNHRLLNMENLILAIVSILFFYKIATHLFEDTNIKTAESLLLTALFAFNPLYFGVSISFSLDFPVLVFWLGSIYAVLYNRMILFTLLGTIMVFSKETGILLYFALWSSSFLFYLINIIRSKNNGLNSCCQDFYNFFNSRAGLFYSLIPGILFFCYLIFCRGNLWEGSTLAWNNTGLHTFGYNWAAFANRFCEIFVINFSWIQTLIIFVYLLKFFIPSQNKTFIRDNKNTLVILCFVFIIFIAFNLFFITYNHPRYTLPCVFFLLIFSYHALVNIIKKQNIRVLLLSAMLVLSTVQVFKTVDPLSKMLFHTASFGRYQVLNINPADGLVYNAEYTVIEKLLYQVNKEINIDENTSLIVSDLWAAHINGDTAWSVINTDKKDLQRTFKRENTFQPKTYSTWDINKNNKPEEAYYIHMWFGERKAELEHLQKYYKITETKMIERCGYFFYLYKLEQL